MLEILAPRISCSPCVGRELTPGDQKFPSDPVVVASQGSSLSHSAWNPRSAPESKLEEWYREKPGFVKRFGCPRLQPGRNRL